MKNTITFLFALILAVLMMSVNAQAQGIDFENLVKVFKPKAYLGTVRSGDIDGDGIPDLVTGGYDSLYVLKGNGNGTFSPLWKNKIGQFYDLKIADFNNDGKQDFVFPVDGNDLGLLINNGSGGFLTLKTYHIGGDSWDISVADFNQDGFLDVAAPTSHDLDPHYKYMAIFINNKNSTFKNRVLYSVPPINYDTPQGITGFYVNSLDMNDDGYADVVQPYIGKDSAIVYYNKTDGTFNAPVRMVIPRNVSKTCVRDMDHDGKEDFIALGERSDIVVPTYNFGFYLQKSAGNDQSIINNLNMPYRSGFYDYTIEDLNKDGEYDLIIPQSYTIGEDPDYTTTDSITIYYNQGNVTFDLSTPSYKKSTGIKSVPNSFILDDFNEDNLLDFACIYEDSTVYILFQKNLQTTSSLNKSTVEKVRIYPNPTSTVLNIDAYSLDNIKNIFVFDAMGRLVYQESRSIERDILRIDLSAQPKGLYLLRVENDKGLQSLQNFVIE